MATGDATREFWEEGWGFEASLAPRGTPVRFAQTAPLSIVQSSAI